MGPRQTAGRHPNRSRSQNGEADGRRDAPPAYRAGPPAFSITVEPQRDGARIVPRGELDIATAGQLERELAELVAAGFARITVDLRPVEFIDSTGLHVLLKAQAQAQNDRWELSIIPGPVAVQHIFELTSTVDHLPFSMNGRSAGPGS